ncbi:MAG: NAD+ synthase, partial [Cyanobacteria bacterium P01_A01_bin.83]
DDLIFDGNSVAFNYAGDLVSHGKAFETDLVVVEWDELISSSKDGEIGRVGEWESGRVGDKGDKGDEEIGIQGDRESGRVGDKGELETERLGDEESNQEIYSALVLGVRDYARKCGFSKAILGLSGGIDSALVAAVAAEALGAGNVLGVLMPSPYSSDHSVTDALDLIANLGINSQKIEIKEAMTAYDTILEPMFAGTEFGIAEENIQSRIRGNLLMAIANKFGYLLLSTGNKSEMAVGYCTLYGDMNGGLAVIADVPKTRVFELCRWLNRQQEVIPQNIITKPPSAELKPEQKDSDSLPSYEILDDILERIVCQHQSPTAVIEAGHDPETVAKVVKLVTRAEFKRRQAPPGIKITDRAFGTGWRMPIASKWAI